MRVSTKPHREVNTLSLFPQLFARRFVCKTKARISLEIRTAWELSIMPAQVLYLKPEIVALPLRSSLGNDSLVDARIAARAQVLSQSKSRE